MKFRVANIEDKNYISQMYRDGQASLQKDGVDQWQKNEMPNTDGLADLVEKEEIFVLEDEKPVATCILKSYDNTYDKIYDGQWLDDKKYYAIHRVATLEIEKKKGYAKKLFEKIEEFAKEKGVYSLKVDTHRDNLKMQSLLKKMGYRYCGIIYLENKKERLAFQKIINA